MNFAIYLMSSSRISLKVSLYRFLIKENLELPQNWIELYKYGIFHEI